MEDIRYALRLLAKNPAFTLATVGTLALAIGATTAIFSVVQGVLLQPLPYHEPERLVRVWEVSPQGENRNVVSAGNYLDWRDRAPCVRKPRRARRDVRHRAHRRGGAAHCGGGEGDALGIRHTGRSGAGRTPVQRRGRPAGRPASSPDQRPALAAAVRGGPRRSRTIGHAERRTLCRRRRDAARLRLSLDRRGHLDRAAVQRARSRAETSTQLRCDRTREGRSHGGGRTLRDAGARPADFRRTAGLHDRMECERRSLPRRPGRKRSSAHPHPVRRRDGRAARRVREPGQSGPGARCGAGA